MNLESEHDDNAWQTWSDETRVLKAIALLSSKQDRPIPPLLIAAFAKAIENTALDTNNAAFAHKSLAAFALLTNDASENLALFTTSISLLLAVWLKPLSEFTSVAHAVTLARNVLNASHGEVDEPDVLIQALSLVLAHHCLGNPTPAFSRLCLDCLLSALGPNAFALLPTSLLQCLTCICMLLGGDNVPEESMEVAFKTVQLATGSKSLKVARRAVLSLCDLVNGRLSLTNVFPGMESTHLSSRIIKTGAMRVVAHLCFVPVPSINEFASTDGIRRMILSSFIEASQIVVLNSTETRAEDSLESEANVHRCLVQCVLSWVRLDGGSLSPTDWEDIIQMLHNLKDYVFQHSLQSMQKFEIGNLHPTAPTAATTLSTEASYIEICTLLYAHYPPLPGATPQMCYGLFLTLVTLARNTVVLSEPILLGTIDYACSSASWLSSDEPTPLITTTTTTDQLPPPAAPYNASSSTSLQSNINRLVFVYFKSKLLGDRPNPLYTKAQLRILDNTTTLLECSHEYETATTRSGLSSTLMDVLTHVVTGPTESFDAAVVERTVEASVAVARGGDAGTFRELVGVLKRTCCRVEAGVASLQASRGLLRLFRFCMVERDCVGCDGVFDAVREVVADTRVGANVRGKCLEWLLSLRVEGAECCVGLSCSEELSRWLGLGEKVELKSRKLRACNIVHDAGAPVVEAEPVVVEDGQRVVTIHLDPYFVSLLEILKLETSWEIYSLVMHGFEPQLRNMALFPQLLSHACVEKLREHFCEVVVSEIVAASVADLPTTVKKSDLYLLVFKTLMTMLLWDHLFFKAQTDDVLRCFQLGLNRWPTTARYCMQCLTLLLTEIPGPMTRLVPDLLMKVSRITSNAMAAPILEFLSTLARLPLIYVNLTESDYKRIFGIALQNVHGIGGGSEVVLGYTVQLAHQVLRVWFVNMNVGDRRKYVPFIIGHVLPEGTNGSRGLEGGAPLDESVELVMDMLVQNSFTDCVAKPDAFEGVAAPRGGEEEANGNGMASGLGFGLHREAVEKSWIQGNSVLTVRNLNMSGWVEVTVRRPSGTMVFSMKLENRARFSREDVLEGGGVEGQVPAVVEKVVQEVADAASSGSTENVAGDDPDEMVSFDAELSRKDARLNNNSLSRTKLHLKSASSIKNILQTTQSKTLQMDPSFILLQLSPYPPLTAQSPCIPLPTTEEAFTRGLKVLDRTPVSDLHKIGVLYIGRAQTHENEILKNDSGSPAYTRFICALGQLVRLKGLKRFNTGGLDTSEAGIDGKTCVVWQDAASGNQMVFHITTLMPTMETDPQCSLKKRHVGNDFVSVLFDESGGDEIGFDTVPGQFNFVNIVVTPLTGAGDVEYDERKFHVVMRVKPELGLPPLGVFSDEFLVTGESLAGVVRRAAVHANMLAVVVAQTRAGGGGFISNARERLRQIKRLAERAQKGVGATPSGASELEMLLDFTRFS
ncbi:Tuberous sclerosis 2-like protein [Podochytrium sp. JEL0797]|nr:Tuberous sclerosis 2-like protein [Podochytrium sp. JEL0797]